MIHLKTCIHLLAYHVWQDRILFGVLGNLSKFSDSVQISDSVDFMFWREHPDQETTDKKLTQLNSCSIHLDKNKQRTFAKRYEVFPEHFYCYSFRRYSNILVYSIFVLQFNLLRFREFASFSFHPTKRKVYKKSAKICSREKEKRFSRSERSIHHSYEKIVERRNNRASKEQFQAKAQNFLNTVLSINHILGPPSFVQRQKNTQTSNVGSGSCSNTPKCTSEYLRKIPFQNKRTITRKDRGWSV